MQEQFGEDRLYAYVFDKDTIGFHSNARSPSAVERRKLLHTESGVASIGGDPDRCKEFAGRERGGMSTVFNKNSSKGVSNAMQMNGASVSPTRSLSTIVSQKATSRSNIFQSVRYTRYTVRMCARVYECVEIRPHKYMTA